MALIKYGGGIVQMSGSIAGNVYARNRYGNYARARTKPTNPNTGNQQAVRSALNDMATRWAQTLTAAQRTAWNLYAASVNMTNKLGETINLSGFNHYIRSNVFLARNGLSLIDDGPTTFELPEADPTFAIAGSEASQELTITFDDTFDWCDEDEAYMLIYQGQPQNPQRNFFNGPWRALGLLEGDNTTPITSPQTIAVDFAITEGQRQWAYARIARADGRLSSPFQGDAAVGA